MTKKIILAVVAITLPTLSQAAGDGQKIFQQKCKVCHKINGVGGKLGPDLSKVAERRDEAYIRQKLQDPTKTNESSVMPPFHGSDEETKALVEYLETLK